LHEADDKKKEEPKKAEGGSEEKAPVDPVDTKDGLYKDMKIDGNPFRAILSTYDAIANKQEAMGKTEIGVISLPGDENVYELLPGGDGKEETKESEIHESEGYIEVMDTIRIANALAEVQKVWQEWKSGPMTEPKDIKPAQKDLKGWIDRWFKDNIK
jgi:hypothetical protein